MSAIKPEIQGLTFVLVGDFNPKIFHPLWFSKHGLIGEHESEEAKVEVIHSDVAVFNLDWVRVQVTRDRFDISTTQEAYFEVLRDLVVSIFNILEHTPIKMLGINYQIHFKMKNEEEWHSLGHRLAPKESWVKVLNNPGMQKVSIKRERTDGYKGNIIVSVEPSSKIKHGAYFSINDHYESDLKDGESWTGSMVSIIKENWEESVERSKTIPLVVLEG